MVCKSLIARALMHLHTITELHLELLLTVDWTVPLIYGQEEEEPQLSGEIPPKLILQTTRRFCSLAQKLFRLLVFFFHHSFNF